MGGPDWAALAKLVGGCLSIIVIAIGGIMAGRKSGAGRSVEGEVVAATFTERALMQQLIAELSGTRSELIRLNNHLTDDRHERDLAKAVSDALDKRRA